MSPAAPSGYSKDNPFPARLREARLLNQPGTAKETRHFVVDLSGSGLTYKAGDSLGVFPSNRPEDVAEILGHLGATGAEEVRLPRASGPVPLRVALARRLALTGPTRQFVETLAARAAGPGAKRPACTACLPRRRRNCSRATLAQREFADLLAEYPERPPRPAGTDRAPAPADAAAVFGRLLAAGAPGRGRI